MTSSACVEDRYVVRELLGSGAMGEVFAAYDRERGIDVALKRLSPSLAHGPLYRDRFMREAAICARVTTPHVVRVLGYAVTRDDVPCIAYERLHGETLDSRIEREGGLSRAETVAVVTQIARALTTAHRLGVVHRDVKPANVFLVGSPSTHVHAKLIDFGVAEAAGADGRFAPCVIAGTPEYMAPEQLLGDRRPNARDDVYALAVVAFECLTGRIPFEGDFETLQAWARDRVIPSVVATRPDLDRAVDAWFRRALGKAREHRFGSAHELAHSLERVLVHAPAPIALAA